MGPVMAELPPTTGRGQGPPCVTKGHICRGCPGWAAMRRAIAPGGAWSGGLIHCAVTGRTVRAADPPAKPAGERS